MPCDPDVPRKPFVQLLKLRFCKSVHALTTNQLRAKTQPTKVVALLKRFGRPTHPLAENRIFYLKIGLQQQ